jgi:hypothetical protein
MKTPILFIEAEHENLVSNTAIRAFYEANKQTNSLARILTIDGADHSNVVIMPESV